MPRLAPLALVLAAAGAAGCSSLIGLQSPRTVDCGALSVALEGGGIVTRAGAGGEEAPLVGVATRIGVTDLVELGLRVGSSRPELLAKIQLWRAGPDEVVVAIAPTLGLWVTDGETRSVQVHSQTTALVGVPAGGFSDVVFGLGLHVTAGGELDSGASALALTPTLSVGWFVRAHRYVGIVPEVGAGYPLLHVGTGDTVVGGGVALQAGLAIVIGGERGLPL